MTYPLDTPIFIDVRPNHRRRSGAAESEHTMSKGIKCIICQSWDVVSADGYTVESRNCYVTNEDGTPHVYDTIKKARADIRGNYGRYPNANGFLRDVYTDEYSGKTTYSYISIIREDSDDYEYAMRMAEQQAAATTERTKKYADLAEQAAREVVEAKTLADADVTAALDSDYSARLTSEAIKKAGMNPDDLAGMIIQARRYNWTAEETAEEIAYYTDLRTANAAARAFLDAYAETIGEYPDDEDAETRAAYKVARADIVARGREASDEQRATVDNMLQYIVDSATWTALYKHADAATEEAKQAKESNDPATISAHANASKMHASKAQRAAEKLRDEYAKELAHRAAVAANDATDADTAADFDAAARLVLDYSGDALKNADPAPEDIASMADLIKQEQAEAEAIEEAAAACEAGNVNIWSDTTGEYVAVNLAPAGIADALINAFCSDYTPQEIYDACIALADAYTGGEDTSAEEVALGVQVSTGPFIKEWHMVVDIDETCQDFTDHLAEDAADETCARETLRRRWNHRKERRFYLAPDTKRIVDVYYNLI